MAPEAATPVWKTGVGSALHYLFPGLSGRGRVTVAVGEESEAASERGIARLLKPWKEMGE